MDPEATKRGFGGAIRYLREGRYGLRQFAEMVGMSPTYLSKVERGEFPPPAEEKIKAIAKVLEQNEDELLALAGRVSSDLNDIIRQQPRPLATFLRTASGLSVTEIERLTKDAQARGKPSSGKREPDPE
jgi:transcriptional regulator with XRE-family HTH domain